MVSPVERVVHLRTQPLVEQRHQFRLYRILALIESRVQYQLAIVFLDGVHVVEPKS